ncbi:GNAT family N-acetyltransferase [candidate division WOR-3 bacterium]|nr:GNAT family N-acetyltransferase [candidate division WOR-3 bacterium]
MTDKMKELKIIVRDAEKNDAPAIGALLGDLGYPAMSEFVLEKIRKLGQRTYDRILVAEKNGQVAGVLSLHIMPLLHHRDNLCRISALVVAPDHRREYIGQRLMEMAEAYAKARKCFRIEVTSNEKRADAHVFYASCGYQERSKRFCKDI